MHKLMLVVIAAGTLLLAACDNAPNKPPKPVVAAVI